MYEIDKANYVLSLCESKEEYWKIRMALDGELNLLIKIDDENEKNINRYYIYDGEVLDVN